MASARSSDRAARCAVLRRAWLESELAAIKPRVVVALGATAAGSLVSPAFRLTDERGKVLKSEFCDETIATFHPSAVLRMPDPAMARAKREAIIDDLRMAARLAMGEPAPGH